MKPRNRREALAIMGIRREERRIAKFESLSGDWSANIACSQRQIDAATERINSGYYLEDANFELHEYEKLERAESRQSYSFQIED
jgi:hypothetical protein